MREDDTHQITDNPINSGPYKTRTQNMFPLFFIDCKDTFIPKEIRVLIWKGS